MPRFTAGQKLRASGLNLIDLLFGADSDAVLASESRANTVFGDLTTVGPQVTITSKGTVALVFISALLTADATTGSRRATVDVSGATTLSASTNETNGFYIVRQGETTPEQVSCLGLLPITPGTNTYKLQYRATSGTITAAQRTLIVLAP